jgi:hypothetical protein
VLAGAETAWGIVSATGESTGLLAHGNFTLLRQRTLAPEGPPPRPHTGGPAGRGLGMPGGRWPRADSA